MKRTQIFSNAWKWFKANLFTSLSDALKAAWKVAKIKASQSYTFLYRKADGSIRQATATTQVPSEQLPKGVRETPSHLVTYFDLDANGWRSFNIANLL